MEGGEKKMSIREQNRLNKDKSDKKGYKNEFSILLVSFLIAGGFGFLLASGLMYLAPLLIFGITLSDFKPSNIKDYYQNSTGGRKAGLITVGLVLIPFVFILLSYMAIMGMLIAIDLLIVLPIVLIVFYFIFRKNSDWKGKLFGSKVVLGIAIATLVVVMGIFAFTQYENYQADNWGNTSDHLKSLRFADADENGLINLTLPNGESEIVNVNEKETIYIQTIDLFSGTQDWENMQTSDFNYDIVKTNESDNRSFAVESKDANTVGTPISNARVHLQGIDKEEKELSQSPARLTSSTGMIKDEVYCGEYILTIERGGYVKHTEHIIINNKSGDMVYQIFLVPIWYDVKIHFEVDDFEAQKDLNNWVEHIEEDKVYIGITKDRVESEEYMLIFEENYVKQNLERQQTMWAFTGTPNLMQNSMIPTQLYLDNNGGLQFAWALAGVGVAIGVGVAVVTVAIYGFTGGLEYRNYEYKYAEVDAQFTYNDETGKGIVYYELLDESAITTKSKRDWTYRVWNTGESGSTLEIKFRVELHYNRKDVDVLDWRKSDGDEITVFYSEDSTEVILNIPFHPTHPDDEAEEIGGEANPDYDDINWEYVKIRIEPDGKLAQFDDRY